MGRIVFSAGMNGNNHQANIADERRSGHRIPGSQSEFREDDPPMKPAKRRPGIPGGSHLLRLRAVAGSVLLLAATIVHAKLNIVATTADLAALAQAIGGREVVITALARPTEDPHFVDAKPSFIVKLSRADALIHGGAELESAWLASLLAGARNAKILPGAPGNIRACQGVQMLEVPDALDRSHGDIHAAGNPHFLVAPENARIVAAHLAEVFGQLDPSSAALYAANRKAFTEQLEARRRVWRNALAPFKGARLVAYHNSWPYFAREFDLEISLFLEPKPGIPPSAAHLAMVMARMKEQQIRVILHDPYLDRRTAETVARTTGARVMNVTQYPGGVKGSEGGYLEMMDYLVHTLAQALAAASPAPPAAPGAQPK